VRLAYFPWQRRRVDEGTPSKDADLVEFVELHFGGACSFPEDDVALVEKEAVLKKLEEVFPLLAVPQAAEEVTSEVVRALRSLTGLAIAGKRHAFSSWNQFRFAAEVTIAGNKHADFACIGKDSDQTSGVIEVKGGTTSAVPAIAKRFGSEPTGKVVYMVRENACLAVRKLSKALSQAAYYAKLRGTAPCNLLGVAASKSNNTLLTELLWGCWDGAKFFSEGVAWTMTYHGRPANVVFDSDEFMKRLGSIGANSIIRVTLDETPEVDETQEELQA